MIPDLMFLSLKMHSSRKIMDSCFKKKAGCQFYLTPCCLWRNYIIVWHDIVVAKSEISVFRLCWDSCWHLLSVWHWVKFLHCVWLLREKILDKAFSILPLKKWRNWSVVNYCGVEECSGKLHGHFLFIFT